MGLLYIYIAYKERVLVPIDVQQKTFTVMELRDRTVSPWSSTFYVGCFCISLLTYIFIKKVKNSEDSEICHQIHYAFTIEKNSNQSIIHVQIDKQI